MECKARLRGLYRIIYSKTISPRLWNAKPACAGYSRQNFIRADPSYPRRSVFYSSFRVKARLRVTRTPTVTLSTIDHRLSAIDHRLSATISPRLSRAKPACAGYGGLFLQRPSFRSPRGGRDSGNVQPRPLGSTFLSLCGSIHQARSSYRLR